MPSADTRREVGWEDVELRADEADPAIIRPMYSNAQQRKRPKTEDGRRKTEDGCRLQQKVVGKVRVGC
ncbi:hypothetical protein VPNG_10257 [Cytospora leucostoma]|uniref:Uncharacterized protein n=1 Tax=Cytospora leucostoma TaxID=1230097 RepID=A0A423VEN5_9PEZI|nr:hypothetical protein VPNG_10257 [Cytospora leucostoma]